MSIEMVSADDAIAQIKSCTLNGGKVLGVDCFQMVPEGHIGRLDLILDLSPHLLMPEAAEAEAIEFVKANCASDIRFEVIAGWPDDVL